MISVEDMCRNLFLIKLHVLGLPKEALALREHEQAKGVLFC